MPPLILSRRIFFLGAPASLGGCSALSSLNAAATPLDTYDLSPVSGTAGGRRSSRILLVARPDAPAAISTDRIVVKPTPLSITYLPEARWSDDLPAVLQSLLIRSISGTGRAGYVGSTEGGPVPDVVLLTRLDTFQVEVSGGTTVASIAMHLTLLQDRDQRVIATREFRGQTPAADDRPLAVVAAFQSVLNSLLPEIANWVVAS